MDKTGTCIRAKLALRPEAVVPLLDAAVMPPLMDCSDTTTELTGAPLTNASTTLEGTKIGNSFYQTVMSVGMDGVQLKDKPWRESPSSAHAAWLQLSSSSTQSTFQAAQRASAA